jgi:hypothetical protein
VAGPCEHGNEPSGSIKGGEFFDQLDNSWIFKKDSAPWSLLVAWLVGWLVSYLKQLITVS